MGMGLRMWSYVDFVIIVFNIMIAFTTYDELNMDKQLKAVID